jgi:hypothetical protein
MGKILDLLPIAYVIRIDTSDSQTYQHSRPMSLEQTPEPVEVGAGVNANA